MMEKNRKRGFDMRNNKKTKIANLFLVLSLILGVMMSTVVTAPKVQAADAYMEKLHLNWNLQKGKEKILTATYPGIGKRKYGVKITSLKIEDAAKEGYKKLTVAYKSTRKWEPKKKEVDKIFVANAKERLDYVYVPEVYAYAVTDFDTGFSLEGENDLNVSVKDYKWKISGVKKYKGSKGRWMKMWKTASTKFEVTYPADYTGLCIGLLGQNTEYGEWFTISDNVCFTPASECTVDRQYFTGEKYKRIKKHRYVPDENANPFRFGQTSYYTHGKKNSCWMRIK